MTKRLRILIVDSNPERAAIVEAGLSGLSNVQILRAHALIDVSAKSDTIGADVIAVACDSLDHDTLDSMREIGATRPLPIVMFVEKSHQTWAEEAIHARIEKIFGTCK